MHRFGCQTAQSLPFGQTDRRSALGRSVGRLYNRPVQARTEHNLRCVVWTPPGDAMPAPLDSVLQRRGIDPMHCDAPCPVIAELCLAERDADDADDSGPSGPRSVLILAGVRDPGRMLSAIERFAPSAQVWIYEPGANPPLRAFVVRPMPAAVNQDQTDAPAISSPQGGTHTDGAKEAHPIRVGDSRPASATELKLAPRPADQVIGDAPPPRAGEESSPAEQEPPSRPRRVSARDVLEDAELEMLLAGEGGTEGHAR